MPIEFECNSCGATLRVPDQTAGKKCQCPTCQQTMTIPTPEVSAASAHSAVPDNAEPTDSAQEDTLRIPCPSCNYVLNCSRDLLGTKGQCRKCETIFTISESPTQVPDSTSLVFECPSCNQLFEGNQEMQGKRGKCHACGEVFTIELKPAKPKPASPRPVPSAARSAQTKPPGIEFACGSCGGKMKVPGTTAGQQTACPYCQTILQIPAASQTTADSSFLPESTTRSPAHTTRPAKPQPAAPSQSNVASPQVTQNIPAFDSLSLDDMSGMASPAAADPFAAAPNPYANAPVSNFNTPSARRPGSLPSGRDSVVYTLPGAFTLVIGAIFSIFAIFSLVVIVIVIVGGTESQLDPGRFGYVLGQSMGQFAVQAAAAGIFIAAGIAMIRRTNLVLCRVAAVLACVPCLCLNFPIGIWACIVLFSSKASQDFAS